jgi:hypothetical protein
MVIASGSTPDGATTLQFGHTGWLFDDDVDAAVDAVRAAVPKPGPGRPRNSS